NALSEGKIIHNEMLNPLPALQSAPEGDIVDTLRNSVGISITYNGSSPYDHYIDEDIQKDCNGHPRTLEKFYELLHDHKALNNDTYSSLIERLARSLETSLGTLTLRDIISLGIYINSLTNDVETFRVIPTLSLVGLQHFAYSIKTPTMMQKFHANWELLYRALHNEKKEISLYEIYGLKNVDQPKIELGRKIGIVKVENIEFPPSG
ncbi:10445_t:CDS:2, partial [Gigaspora rosea]